MDIFWLGNYKFRLKGKVAAAIVDTNGVLVEELLFEGPGEYESKGIMVTGIATEEGTAYQIGIDNVQVVYLTSAAKVEEIEQTDILLTPVASVIADLEPKMIIPYAEDQESLSKLVKELGGEGITPLPKLTISKDKLPEEPTIVILENAK
jgi:hypothetical protein